MKHYCYHEHSSRSHYQMAPNVSQLSHAITLQTSPSTKNNKIMKSLRVEFSTYSSDNIDNWSFVCLLGILKPCLFRDEGPQLVQIDSGAEVLLLSQMEVAHTDFSKITRMAGKSISKL